jgi:hypothetical protein
MFGTDLHLRSPRVKNWCHSMPVPEFEYDEWFMSVGTLWLIRTRQGLFTEISRHTYARSVGLWQWGTMAKQNVVPCSDRSFQLLSCRIDTWADG